MSCFDWAVNLSVFSRLLELHLSDLDYDDEVFWQKIALKHGDTYQPWPFETALLSSSLTENGL
jgi:hypothetical protein